MRIGDEKRVLLDLKLDLWQPEGAEDRHVHFGVDSRWWIHGGNRQNAAIVRCS